MKVAHIEVHACMLESLDGVAELELWALQRGNTQRPGNVDGLAFAFDDFYLAMLGVQSSQDAMP